MTLFSCLICNFVTFITSISKIENILFQWLTRFFGLSYYFSTIAFDCSG